MQRSFYTRNDNCMAFKTQYEVVKGHGGLVHTDGAQFALFFFRQRTASQPSSRPSSLAVGYGTKLGPTANGCHERGVDPACSAPSSTQKPPRGGLIRGRAPSMQCKASRGASRREPCSMQSAHRMSAARASDLIIGNRPNQGTSCACTGHRMLPGDDLHHNLAEHDVLLVLWYTAGVAVLIGLNDCIL